MAVIVGGWAAAGWQNRPPIADASAPVFVLAIVASCVACFLCGRSTGKASAFAAAYARAEARAAAVSQASAHAQQAVVVNVDTGARQVGARELVGLDGAEWIGPPRPLLEQDTAQMVAEDLLGDVQDVGHVEVH